MARRNPFVSQNVDLLTPGQKQYGSGALNQSQQIYQGLMKPSIDVGPEAQIADSLREFRQRAVPGIAQRFTGLSPSAQRSSGFAQTMGSQAVDLISKIDALRSKMGLDVRGQDLQRRGQDINLMSLLQGAGMTPQFKNYTMERPRSAGEKWADVGQSLVPKALDFGLNWATGGASGGAKTIKEMLSGLWNKIKGGNPADEASESPSDMLSEQQEEYLMALLSQLQEMAPPPNSVNQSSQILQGLLR